MIAAPKLNNEKQRLASLRRLNILDTEADERYDRFTRIAKEALNVPIALVSLIDSDRQWFKSKVGTTASETSRDISFCGHAINQEGVYVVENALEDPRFCDNPLVIDEPSIRFYAAYPLKLANGCVIGTLCIIDYLPRKFSEHEKLLLSDLGRLVEVELSKEKRRVFATDNRRKKNNRKSFQFSKEKTKKLVIFERLVKRSNAVTLSLLFFLTVLFVLASWFNQIEKAENQLKQRKATEYTANVRARIENELNTRLHLTHGLAGFVVASDKVNEARFQQFAKELGRNLRSVTSLQLAPNGIVTHVWPYHEHFKAIGHDLFADPERLQAANNAISARNIWLAGPVNLIQGGQGIIGRYPIFTQSDGQEIFWGFATVLIDFKDFIEELNLHEFGSNYELAIRGKDARGRIGNVFYGEEKTFNNAIAVANVTLPAGSWTIGVSSTELVYKAPLKKYLVATLISIVLSYMVYLLFRLPSRFKKAVDESSKALEQSEYRFSDAIEALPDGFVIFDKDDRLVACNSQFREMYGLDRNDIDRGTNFNSIIKNAYQKGKFFNQEQLAYSEFLIERQKEHFDTNSTSELQLASGRWIRQSERPIRGGGVVGLRVDITESKRKEQELAEAKESAEIANLTKSQFLATVSHEVRTPLNVVLGLLEILRASNGLTKTEYEYALTAHQSAEHLLHLLNEILDISKVEAGKLELEFSAFDFPQVLNKLQSVACNLASDKGIGLKLDICRMKDAVVIGDKGRVYQVLLNLISNAIKFTDKGEVKIIAKQIERDDSNCVISVSVIDSGIGFSYEQSKKLFKPFSQIDSGASRKHEGTGLGLSISKEIVTMMGGTIKTKAKLGVGAIFKVTFPFTKVPRTELKTKDTVKKLGGTRTCSPVKLLIAEDSPSNQVVFRAMLEGQGYLIDIAENGRDAVKLAKKNAYNLILMDIYMPELNGIEATKIIRDNKILPDTPIIALTANAMKGDREKFLQAGMDDYLPKPINKENLISLIEKWQKSCCV